MASNISLVVVVVLIVIVAAAGGAGAYAIYYYEKPSHPSPPTVVAVGDNVTVDYIGIFGSGPDSGKVFDTSIFAVSQNSALYPKSIQYQPRGDSPKNYTPLGVHVGANTPSSGYTLGNLTFVGVVTGFWQGLVGAYPNQSKVIVVPPAQGYGYDIPSCVVNQPITEHFPVFRSMSGTQFQKQYPGVSAATGTEFTVPHYGWPALVFSANASFVTVQNLPTVGETSSPAGWPLTVTSIVSTPNGTGQITAVNQLNPAQAGLLVGTDFASTGPSGCSQSGGHFIVSAINLAAGTYTQNFNSEVTGQTLIFQVYPINIFPPGTVG